MQTAGLDRLTALCSADDIMPRLTDDDPLGVVDSTGHVLPLDQAPYAYEVFQTNQDGAVKVTLKP